MDPSEATRQLEATRDDLVRDLVATLTELGLRRLTPLEIEQLGAIVVRHLRSTAILATRYEQEKGDDEPTRVAVPPAAPEHGWISEVTPARRPSRRPKRVLG